MQHVSVGRQQTEDSQHWLLRHARSSG